MRLGLCADGFNPYTLSSRSYSIWLVVVTPYNLPLEMGMITPFMFLACVILGPKNPKNKIDVYLQPLVDELKGLCDVGVETYDIFYGAYISDEGCTYGGPSMIFPHMECYLGRVLMANWHMPYE